MRSPTGSTSRRTAPRRPGLRLSPRQRPRASASIRVPRLATLGSFLVALILLMPQYFYSRHLDLTLAKRWNRLPVWGVYGTVSPASRRTALYEWTWLGTGLAFIFVGLSARNDIYSGVRSSAEMVLATAIAVGVWTLIYPVRIYMVRRWIRTGKPRVKGMKHPTKNRD